MWVSTLRVSSVGLQAHAEHCLSSAQLLARPIAVAVAGPPTQATALAVDTAYAALNATAATLAARAESLAGKLTVTASQYERTDEVSGLRLSASIGGQSERE